jgi:lysozyme
MQCGAAGIALIKSFESCRLEAYLDQDGIPTIGWGQTGPFVQMGMTITQDQADAWLLQMIQSNSAAMNRMIRIAVNQNQYDALSSLVYNIGLGDFSSSSTLALLNQGDFADVPYHMSLFNKITDPATGQKIVDLGLVRRRAAEVSLFNTPIIA